MSTRCPSLELCRRCTQQFERHTDCGCCRGKRIHSPFDAQPLQHRARDERITLAARVHRESDYGFLTSSPASASEGWLASSETGGPPFPGRMETLVGSLAKLMSRSPTTAQPRRCRDNLSANLRGRSIPFAKTRGLPSSSISTKETPTSPVIRTPVMFVARGESLSAARPTARRPSPRLD